MFNILKNLAAWFPKAGIDPEKDTPAEASAKVDAIVASLKAESSAGVSELATQLATAHESIKTMETKMAELEALINTNAEATNKNFEGMRTTVADLTTSVTDATAKMKDEVSTAIAQVKTSLNTPKGADDATPDEKDKSKPKGNVVEFSEADWKPKGSKVRVSATEK